MFDFDQVTHFSFNDLFLDVVYLGATLDLLFNGMTNRFRDIPKTHFLEDFPERSITGDVELRSPEAFEIDLDEVEDMIIDPDRLDFIQLSSPQILLDG